VKICICKESLLPIDCKEGGKAKVIGMKGRNKGRKTRKENCWVDNIRYKVSKNMFKIILPSNTVF
jgi:hypothetical protein